MKKPVYYFDLDGVTFLFKKVSVEETMKPRFFIDKMEKDPLITFVIRKMFENGEDVRFLSKYYTETNALAEKKESLVLNKLSDIPAVFVPYTENKFDYVNKNEFNVLIDDFSPNLFEWKKNGGVGIKYYNGVNGTKGTWRSYSVNRYMTADECINTITGISEKILLKGA